jgi:leucyl-tRNA synthetase
MIFINAAEKQRLSPKTYETFLKLLAPFAPHLTEELWSTLGMNESLHTTSFPDFDADLAADEMVTIGVQINGKMRGSITIPPNATEEEALCALNADTVLRSKVEGRLIIKAIYVPGRILNVILKE